MTDPPMAGRQPVLSEHSTPGCRCCSGTVKCKVVAQALLSRELTAIANSVLTANTAVDRRRFMLDNKQLLTQSAGL